MADNLLSADVAIVGGGVAGSSLAAALAAAGLDVVILEREPRFRDRVRGEGIHPWGVKEAEKLGLLPVLQAAGAHELPTWQIYRGREPVFAFRWDDNAPGWPGEWAIYHPTLQQALIDHAAACGARVLRPARATGLERTHGTLQLAVTSDNGPRAVRARLVVGADGRQSLTRRWLGAETLYDPPHHQIGGCLLDGLSIAADRAHDASFSGGFAMLFPQGGGRARAYYICADALADPLRGHGHELDFIAACAAALPDGALAGARPAGPLAFFPNADIWADRVAGNGLALLGDAAGANDPSRGQGLAICFRDARELRDWLLNESDWHTALAGYAARRTAYYAVLRANALWSATLTAEIGPEADARRARAELARKLDPELGGFASIISRGPDGLVADEAARRHYLGEDLD